jgi:PAS domain-containing protein
MQAVMYSVRDAVARLGIAKCQGCVWGGQNPGLGLVGPAPEIQNALNGDVGSRISALAIGTASRLDIVSFSIISIMMLAGIFSVTSAWFIIRRANCKGQHGNQAYDRFYQALIRNSQLPIAILGRDIRSPLSFCGGNEILLECLAGPDAAQIARALDALLRKGVGFKAALRGSGNREILVHGTPVGRFCAIYFSVGKSAGNRSAILDARDAIPIPTRVRQMDRPIAANDQHHHSQMNLATVPTGGSAGAAADIADTHSAERRLHRMAEVFAQVVEHTPFAMAIFDSHQKLAAHNRKYALLWGLPEAWLQNCPSKGEIIDRLRDDRKLPEQKNFQQWKRVQLQPSADTDMKTTELWHLPGGESLRVVTTSHPEGGQLMMFEDISERLALEASLNLLSHIQKATIDALEDAVAIFGPDGRLMLHNSNFEELWRFTPAELSNRPHCSDIARICDARMGRDEIWQVISDAINAMVPTTIIDMHETRRENGHHVSLTLSRLPDGMTMAVFSDFSDLNRFETMLEEDRSIGRDVNSQLPQTG